MCVYNWPNLDKNSISDIPGLPHVQISSAIPLLWYSNCFDIYLPVENCQTDTMSMFWLQYCVFIFDVQLSGKLLYSGSTWQNQVLVPLFINLQSFKDIHHSNCTFLPTNCKITVDKHTFIFHGITSDHLIMKPNKTCGHDYASSKVICTMIYNHLRMGQVAYRSMRNIQGAFRLICQTMQKSEEWRKIADRSAMIQAFPVMTFALLPFALLQYMRHC